MVIRGWGDNNILFNIRLRHSVAAVYASDLLLPSENIVKPCGNRQILIIAARRCANGRIHAEEFTEISTSTNFQPCISAVVNFGRFVKEVGYGDFIAGDRIKQKARSDIGLGIAAIQIPGVFEFNA